MKTLQAIKKSLEGHWGLIEWLAISAVIFILLIMVPVWTTPGNDFLFQLSILDTEVLVIMIILSILNGLLIVMQLYVRKTVKTNKKLKHQAAKGATAFGILVSSLTATLACAACYSSILALLGLGASAFIAEHRIWIALGAIGLTLFAIYYSARRINNHCAVCTI